MALATLVILEQQKTRLADSLLQSLFAPESPTSTNPYMSTTAAIDRPAGAAREGTGLSSGEAQPLSKMRSSIACVRCRRSKVKCVNNGVGTTCRACQNSRRDCAYPAPLPSYSKRRDYEVSERSEGVALDLERRVRPRKTAPTSEPQGTLNVQDGPRPSEALDPRLLTPAVWSELFEVFQLHYSTDLPFLHPPTFLKPLRQAAVQQAGVKSVPVSSATARPLGSDAFLLSFLALTSRFHPRIVAHHSPPSADRLPSPSTASEHYATAALERLYSDYSNVDGVDFEQLQANLMLGLHEWGMCRGAKAWVRIGSAIRAAQALGLQYETALDDQPMSRSAAFICKTGRTSATATPSRRIYTPAANEVDCIQREIRRRTFWSCFIMDRHLSSGKYRPQSLHAKDVRIQLPASEQSFLFGEKVYTPLLGEGEAAVVRRASVQTESAVRGTSDEQGRFEIGADEGLVSRYTRIIEIYGSVVRWLCAGGRRQALPYLFALSRSTLTCICRIDRYSPWDQRSEWYELVRVCNDFEAALPRQHTLTPQNVQAYISMKTSTTYTLVHTVHLLCQILLHREYLPLVAMQCSKPEGPLDEPLFPPDKFDVPPNFWEDSAKECFGAARRVMDLLSTCQEWSASVETPIVGFTFYVVAFVGVYRGNFPWMDPDDAFDNKSTSMKRESVCFSFGEKYSLTLKAVACIRQMRPRLRMARGWNDTILRLNKYFRKVKSDYLGIVRANDSTTSGNASLSTLALRLGERNADAVDESKILERGLNDIEGDEDLDVNMVDTMETRVRPSDAVYDDSSTGMSDNSDDSDQAAVASGKPSRPDGPWNAINNAALSQPPSASDLMTKGPFRTYESYQQTSNPRPYQPTSASPHDDSKPNHTQHEISAQAGPPPDVNPSAERKMSMASAQQSQPNDPAHSTYASRTPQHQSPYRLPSLSQACSNAGTSESLPPLAANPHAAPRMQAQAYPSPSRDGVGSMQSTPVEQHSEPIQASNIATSKEAWVDAVVTDLTADDLAAFVDGSDIEKWVSTAAANGLRGGWLTAVWKELAD